MQKRSRVLLITTYLILFLAMVLFLCLGINVSSQNAKANTWNVRVTKYVDLQYLDLSTGDRVTDSSDLYFLISGYGASDIFQYYMSANSLNEEALKNVLDGNWEGNATIDTTITLDDTTYIYIPRAVDSNFDKYIYFRRQYTSYENENPVTKNDYYSVNWHIIVNTNLSASDLGFNSITATYLNGAINTPYTSGWVNSSINFTIKTKWMNDNNTPYNPSDELLYYSVDGKLAGDGTKQWRPMSSNKVTIRENLNNVTVYFKSTDIAGKFSATQAYNYTVKMDIESPVFTLNATTINASNDIVDYSNRAWACNDVVFTINNISNCISPIENYVSVDGGASYERLDTSNYTISASTAKVLFRTVNGAGSIANSESYEINIDKITPVVKLSAFTNDPDATASLKPLVITYDEVAGMFKAGYANGNIAVTIDNKNSSGIYLGNTSKLHFYYAVKTGNGNFSSYVELTNKLMGTEQYSDFSDVIGSVVTINKQYKFKIITEAGKISDEVTLSAVLVNPTFAIEVKPITYVANSSGWVATDIRVYVSVPTDTTIVGGQYTVPTTKYTFWYSPINISGAMYSAEGIYANPISEGFSLYYFNLRASAESTFAIYATNAANKRSTNTHITPNIIKIDVLPPETELSAFIKPEDENFNAPYQYISSAEWVNGRVIITLKVKNGVSGVYVKELEYAVDGSGNPLYDDFGNLRWTESTGIKGIDDSIVSSDGTRYYIYKFEKSIPNASVDLFSEEYRFRIYTKSGVSVDKSFVLNIDLSNIALEQIRIGTETTPVNTKTLTLAPVCKDLQINLISNIEQAGHFVYYIYDNELSAFVRTDSNIINVAIPMGYKGEIIKRFYLSSKAKDYKGDVKSTDMVDAFEIIIPYDTLNLAINYELITVMESTVWNIADYVEVKINLVSDIEGNIKTLTPSEQLEYRYFYMLINYKTNINLNEEISRGIWLECSRSNGELDSYQFAINLAGRSFYGYLALSVTNVANFRSSSGDISGNIIKVDNTVPNVKDIIHYTVGEPNGNTYFSTSPISLVQTPDSEFNRSVRSYYYAFLDENGSTELTMNPESGTVLNGWTKLNSNIAFNADTDINGKKIYTQFKIMIYSQNEVGNKAGGFVDGNYTVYTFIIDPATITGQLSYRSDEGIYFDQSLNMYAYMWKDKATISLSIAASNTELQFYFKRDDINLWELYIDPTIGYPQYYQAGMLNAQQLIFSANYFPDGVKTSFTFKAVNRAGAEYVYTQKIYIAIDTTEPEFEIITTINGLNYNGGNNADLTDLTGTWSSVPVNVNINMLKVNVSGVRITYILTYLVNGSPISTAERETPAKENFTTDRIDGFDRNKDAILTIFVTNKSDSTKRMQKSVRLRVDQVEPRFELIGHATEDESSASKTIVSGEWTNRKYVSISKALVANYSNVSEVFYTYTYKDLDSTSIIENDWPLSGDLSYTKTCTITATARTEAGRTYTRVFQVNIDTIPPVIKFMSNISVIEGGNHFIDLKVYVEEENIEICEYITIKEDNRGFALDPNGYILSTSSVDNSTRIDKETSLEYRGYVKIYVKDYAGNTATFVLFILPFDLDVNNVTLSDADIRKVNKYEEDLNEAEVYMESNRVIYFRNLIARLRDRISTIENEITTFRAYLERLAQRSSFELKSDYKEMFSYLETFNNYKIYGQEWVQMAIQGDASSKYFAYFKNLEVVFKQLQKEMAKVEAVEKSTKILPAINMVESSDYNDILRVYDDYNDLTSDQKACFLANLYNKLLSLKKACEILLLTDLETGIKLNGDFAPGAKVNVNNYKNTTEIYNNAQKALLSAVESNGSRAVVSVNRISLIGASSQTSTGDVNIVLPIPTEYQKYIKFAVYKLSEDGTVTEIDKVVIAGDGKSVSFTSNELATFVLATKANIEGSIENEGVYGTILGLELDAVMIRNFVIVGSALFIIVLLVVVIAGIRHKKFLNSYNRAYRGSIYRRRVQKIPKGNTLPRTNPLKEDERVKTPTKPY